jgi:hypothetical protein
MFKYIVLSSRRRKPRNPAVLTDRRPAPMPRIRYYG